MFDRNNSNAVRSYGSNRNNNNGSNQGGSQQNDSWKAQGFLNIYVPDDNGEPAKLGAIPLKDVSPTHRYLLERLLADPSRAAKLKEVMTVEFRSAEPVTRPLSFLDD